MASATLNLLSALVSTFSLVLLGFVLKRLGVLEAGGLRGLGTFITKCALPALVFTAISTLDFSSVRWLLLLALGLGKVMCQAVTIFLSLMVDDSRERLGRAGLRALFVVVSNDFAFGLPLLSTLYPGEFVNYLYLLAPVNFFIIVPLCIVLLEVMALRTGRHEREENSSLSWSACKGSLLNPLVVMTILGLVCNFAFHQSPPAWLMTPLTTLGASFSSVALVLLGSSISGNMRYFRDEAKLTQSVVLTLAKTLVVPTITALLVTTFEQRNQIVEDCDYDLALFAFIYGTIPSAPSVIAFAAEYNLDKPEMATGLVMCTLLSAPLLFVSAKMALLSTSATSAYAGVNQETLEDLSLLSVSCVTVLAIVLLANRRVRAARDRTVLLAAAFLFALCLLSNLCRVRETSSTLRLARYLGLWCAEFGSRMGGTLVVVQLVGPALHSWAAVWNRKWSLPVGLALPFLLALVYFAADPWYRPGISSEECWGGSHDKYTVLGVLFAFLFSNFVVQAACLVAMFRRGRTASADPAAGPAGGGVVVALTSEGDDGSLNGEDASLGGVSITEGVGNHDPSHETTPLLLAVPSNGRRARPRSPGGRPAGGAPQLPFKHRAYVFVTAFSAMVCTGLTAWKLSGFSQNGVLLEMEFLDNMFNYLQGFVLFVCFGTDYCLYQGLGRCLAPVGFWFRRVFFEAELLDLPDDVSEATPDCLLFSPVADKCRSELCETRTYHLRTYHNVLRGCDLVDWLLREGLAASRPDGLRIGQSLVMARVLHHVHREHYFHDHPYFYLFQPDFLDRLRAICAEKTDPALPYNGQVQ